MFVCVRGMAIPAPRVAKDKVFPPDLPFDFATSAEEGRVCERESKERASDVSRRLFNQAQLMVQPTWLASSRGVSSSAQNWNQA